MVKTTFNIQFLIVVVCILVLAAVPGFAQPAEQAQAERVEETMRDLLERIEQGEFGPDSGQHRTSDGTVVSFAGDVVIEADQTIERDAVAIGGSVEVHGTVKGNVVSIGGSCRLAETARVHGDVLAIGGTVERDDAAVVDGSKVQIAAPWARAFIAQLRERAERPRGMEDLEPQAPAKKGVQPEDEAVPETERKAKPPSGEGIVEFGEDVVVQKNEVVDDYVVVFEGDVHVFGKVDGDIVAMDGEVDVRPFGQVVGSIFAIGRDRDVVLRPGAHVSGDVFAVGGDIHRAHGARIDGKQHTFGYETRTFDVDRVKRPFWRLGRRVLNNFAFLVLLLILVVALPNQMDAVATRVSEEPGRALLYGLIGLLLVLPMLVVMVFMVITWALIPLFIAAVAGLGLVGMVGMDLLIGRKLAAWMRLSTTSMIGMAILGFIILAVAGMLADLPVVGAAGGIFLLAVFVFGFGGALMTGFGADPSGTWLFGERTSPHEPAPEGPAPRPHAEAPSETEAEETPEPQTPPEDEDTSAADAEETPQRTDDAEPDEPGSEMPEPEDDGTADTPGGVPPGDSGWTAPEE